MQQKDRNIIELINSRIKEANLKPEEIQAINKARNQVYTQTSVGGVMGALGTYFLTRKKRISPFFLLPLIGGGFLVSSQIGMALGMMSGMRTINKLPDQARLYNLVKNVQDEVMNANGYMRDTQTGRPRLMTSNEKENFQQHLLKVEHQLNDKSDSESNDHYSGDDTNGRRDTWENKDSNERTTFGKSFPDQRDQQQQLESNSAYSKETPAAGGDSNDAWDKLRQQNQSDDTWARLRASAKEPNDSNTDSNADIYNKDKVMDDSIYNNMDKRGKNSVNQWGDKIE